MKGMVFADRYKLVDFIGQGGMSLVYRAVDVRTGHSVAIKILKTEYNSDKEFLERFQREAQAASLMSHHNIVNLLDVGVEGEHRYLVLEYVSGSTLKEIIQQKGRLNTSTAIQIAVRILSALQHAHDNGIIHRDIKPQNVLVNEDGHVKVADFGIARMTNAFTISKGDTVVGSVHYSSPEQASGNVVEASSDLYSTGVVLYEMLTGHVPFTGDTPVAVAMQHINATPPPITDFNPDVPPAVVAVVAKAMEKNPKRRYQSAREMADALIRARDGRPDPNTPAVSSGAQPQRPQPGAPLRPAPAQGRAQQQQQRKRRSKTNWVLTTMMAVIVFGGLIFGVASVYRMVTSSATAPELIGLSLEEARSAAKRAGLELQESRVNHDTAPAGTIITQMPDSDTEMRKGDSMVVTVSLGPVTLLAPDLGGMTLETASAKLKERNLGMVVFRSASTEPVDTVIAQNPLAGDICAIGQEVEVTVSGGSTLVPDLLKLPYADAVAMIADNSLSLGKVKYIDVTDASEVGAVLAQTPSAGTMTILDAQIALTVGRVGKPYHAEISVSIPENSDGKTLRVVLVESGAEAEQYAGPITGAGATTLIVPVSSDFAGVLLCRVTLDGAALMEQEVFLQ